jgi:hypothetical protein
MMNWPCEFGSGKFVTPWERMQLAKFKLAWVLPEDPPPLALRGSRERQAWLADW